MKVTVPYSDTMMAKARAAVRKWYEVHEIKLDGQHITIVWFSKTLQNWKILLTTTLNDGRYFEATYNGDKRELYLDVYTKEANMVIKDDD
jgi:hypothetical protein